MHPCAPGGSFHIRTVISVPASDPNMPLLAPTVVYRIDQNDCLTFISESWAEAAKASGGYVSRREYLVGRRLWDLLVDTKVIALYCGLVARVRAGHPATFSYRCDTVTRERRFLMRIQITEENEVEFYTTPEQETGRERVPLLDSAHARDDTRVLRMCSMCQQVELRANYWVPMEAAAKLGDLLSTDRLPRLQHALCSACEPLLQIHRGS
jgi:hypothetical protein